MAIDFETPTKRLQKTIVVSSAVGIFTVGLIVAVAGITPLYEYLKEEEKRNLVLALNTKTIAVEQYLARIKDVALQIASRTKAREALESYNNGLIDIAQLAITLQKSMLDALEYAQDIWGLTRLDLQGHPVVSVGLEVPAEFQVPASPEQFNPTVEGPLIVGDNSLVVVRSPIRNKYADLVGTDVIVVRLINLRRIIEDYSGLGKTGETFLGYVKQDKVELLFPTRYPERTPWRNVALDTPIGSAIAASAKERQSGLNVYGQSLGSSEIVVYGPIRGSNWGIGLKISAEELFSPVRRQIFATSTLILVLIGLGTTGMILLVRPLAGKTIIHTDELTREIKEKTAHLRQELRERRRIERWLRDSERRYQTLLANIPDVIFILDDKGCFSYVNVQIEKFLGCRVRDILDTPLEDYVTPEDKPKIRKILETDAEDVWDEEVEILALDGTHKYSRIRCKASIEDNTGSKRYEGVMRDITIRKNLEQELKASREELLEKIRIIDDLYEHIVQSGMSKCISDHTAEVAHELRQPLAIIGGVARRIARRIRSGELSASQELVDACRIIINEIERLERILGGLIDFTTHRAVRLERADPNQIIEDVLRANAGRISDKSLQVEKKLGTEIGDMLLDPTLFEQMVGYLISNAIDASPNGEVLTVETGISIPSEKAQETGGLDSETYFEFRVRNHGKAIPRDELQKIFSPFYTTNSYGAGIGLTVSKRIVEDHNGSISVKSDEEGTVFTVWLPFLRRGVSDLMAIS